MLSTRTRTKGRTERPRSSSLSSSSSSSSLFSSSSLTTAATTASATTTTTTTIVRISFQQYLEEEVQKGTIDSNLRDVMIGVAQSCAEISCRLQTHTTTPPLQLGIDEGDDANNNNNNNVNIQGEIQQEMDVIANDIFISNLHQVGPSVAAMASEEEENIMYGSSSHHPNDDANTNTDADADTSSSSSSYEIAFDPLDGSSNLISNLPVGSIFGIAPYNTNTNTNNNSTNRPFSNPGTQLVAAGYALYSSSTELIVTFGNNHGVMGFTLDPVDTPTFILSRTHIRCPPSGPYYSLNEARYNDWSRPLQKYIQDAKRGLQHQHQHNRNNQSATLSSTGRPLSSRYVCSLCADFHRTLLVGGWCGNPRTHLRLLYEAAPLAFVINAAGGYGCDGSTRSSRRSSSSSSSGRDTSKRSDSDSDGTQSTSTTTTTTTTNNDCNNLLDIVPVGLHDRVCVFLGSTNDIDDLLSYGDVRQVVSKTYEA